MANHVFDGVDKSLVGSFDRFLHHIGRKSIRGLVTRPILADGQVHVIPFSQCSSFFFAGLR